MSKVSECHWRIFTARKPSLQRLLPPANKVCEGYVFTSVCLSTGGGGSASVHTLRGDTPAPQSRHTPPAQCMLGDTANKRAVRILLELVHRIMSLFLSGLDTHIVWDRIFAENKKKWIKWLLAIMKPSLEYWLLLGNLFAQECISICSAFRTEQLKLVVVVECWY